MPPVKPVHMGSGWWVLLPTLDWMGPFPTLTAALDAQKGIL